MTTNDNNYILCRWRDAITDPPPEGRTCKVRCKSAGRIRWLCRHGNRWVLPGFTMPTPLFIESGDQWLDVTNEPAVPRAAVQAAVDEMSDHVYLGEGWVIDESDAFDILRDNTGVTPSEVQS